MTTFYLTPRRLARRYANLPDAVQTDVHIPVDVSADADGYTLTALVPGLAAEAVAIEVLENTITLRGEFSRQELPEGSQVLLQERPSGAFLRTLRLPGALNPAQAEAEVKHGVLTVRVPKAEEARPKQIKVKAK